jgi:hypothetical protein
MEHLRRDIAVVARLQDAGDRGDEGGKRINQRARQRRRVAEKRARSSLSRIAAVTMPMRLRANKASATRTTTRIDHASTTMNAGSCSPCEDRPNIRAGRSNDMPSSPLASSRQRKATS